MAGLSGYQDGTYTRKQERQILGVMLGGKPAARPLGAGSGITSIPSLAATSTTWTVGSFTAVLDVETDATMGPSLCVFDGNSTGSVVAASGSFIRYDLLYVTILDPSTPPSVQYTAGVTGTTLPATPASSIPLAQITVPISGGGAPTITLIAANAVAAGAPTALRTATSALPTNPYDGQLVSDPKNGLRRYSSVSGDWASGLTVSWKARDVSSFVTLPDAAFADITLDTLDIDTAGVGLTGGKFTVPCDSNYLVSGSVNFAASNAGYRVGRYTLNGSAILGSQSELVTNIVVGHSTFLPVQTTLVECSQGDVIALQGLQDSGGGTLAVVAHSQMSIVRV